MATIKISKQHNKPTEEIEELVDDLRNVLEGKYGCSCSRNGDELVIERRGVNGLVKLGDEKVDVDIKLGPMMGMFANQLKPFIEDQLDAHLNED
ncbi:MAG: polyhydroxyalkanoic acid system family protein [Gammaproteobacteria bacterium]|nr:polyhydroxyalkanoic acid system family protein [Gammaproteobacteria bacterium]MBT8150085.1 polyhydroxyalkanoic acid system family protein [Gammaproteobacteria bacterium]NND38735.1 hypothetical protein [Pseudomonadales bacterium]NNL10941.1 hypothetical protein [Pseudomonadales bacterium]NNM12199.1 hypothetical protein [Pseudomonadales bacterium]